jgi:ubiquinone/menaquinone biosynthesis C-methylase UbiE
MEDNKKLYGSKAMAREYRCSSALTPPEISLLDIITPSAANKKMLDIGVGAGRTTKFFAPVFGSYIGLDYSDAMIKECRERFHDMPNACFTEGDARNMQMFEDRSFDFVLFSFNGIDCVDRHDRSKVLREIRRILRPGGKFAFSSHNVYNVEKLYSFQMPRNPMKYFAEYRRMKKVRNLNPPAAEVLKSDSMELVDGDIDFKATYIYIKPELQIKQLTEAGFSDIHIFSLGTGKELPLHTLWGEVKDAWLYYLCNG